MVKRKRDEPSTRELLLRNPSTPIAVAIVGVGTGAVALGALASNAAAERIGRVAKAVRNTIGETIEGSADRFKRIAPGGRETPTTPPSTVDAPPPEPSASPEPEVPPSTAPLSIREVPVTPQELVAALDHTGIIGRFGSFMDEDPRGFYGWGNTNVAAHHWRALERLYDWGRQSPEQEAFVRSISIGNPAGGYAGLTVYVGGVRVAEFQYQSYAHSAAIPVDVTHGGKIDPWTIPGYPFGPATSTPSAVPPPPAPETPAQSSPNAEGQPPAQESKSPMDRVRDLWEQGAFQLKRVGNLIAIVPTSVEAATALGELSVDVVTWATEEMLVGASELVIATEAVLIGIIQGATGVKVEAVTTPLLVRVRDVAARMIRGGRLIDPSDAEVVAVAKWGSRQATLSAMSRGIAVNLAPRQVIESDFSLDDDADLEATAYWHRLLEWKRRANLFQRFFGQAPRTLGPEWNAPGFEVKV